MPQLDRTPEEIAAARRIASPAATRELVFTMAARRAAWFHTTDGRYFASDADRRAHQRTLDERAARYARRVAAYEARQAATFTSEAA